ncbi:hypothetical protein Gotur_014588, partial [Gossypium turneri]
MATLSSVGDLCHELVTRWKHL